MEVNRGWMVDAENKGVLLVKVAWCGAVVNADNFTPQQIEAMLDNGQLEEGPHCLMPDRLDIPF